MNELAKVVGQINILRDLFGQVIGSQEVYPKVTVGKHPAAYAVPLATWIKVRSVYDLKAEGSAISPRLDREVRAIAGDRPGVKYSESCSRGCFWR